jgi:ribosomal-protein-alanine N-acetyltransferase
MAKEKPPRRKPFSIVRFLQPRAGAMPPVRLAYGQVVLRPPVEGDWREWSSLRSRSRKFLKPWEPAWGRDALTRAAFRRRLRNYARDWNDDRSYAFFIFHAENGALLGGITFNNLRRGIIQTASLGYWVGQLHAGRGHMTEAMQAVLRYGFDHLDLHRIEAACVTDNDASRRVLEKTGFRREGLARKYLRIDGRWRDHYTFAILREDMEDETDGGDEGGGEGD